MLNLYTETTIEVKPATEASRQHFQIPRRNGTVDKSKALVRTLPNDQNASGETNSAGQHLATASSFYFRHVNTHPRTFCWRVSGGRRSLEVKSADLSRPEKDQEEAYLTLSFEFQDQILPLGVTFADSGNADELYAFVCTDRNELFSLRLPVSFFKSASHVPQNVREWCRPIDVSSLTIDHVYHIYASSPLEVFVAFAGGKISALKRKPDSDSWSQEHYDDSSWGATIRGIVSRRGLQYLDYGNSKLAVTVPQAMIASSDTTYLYTLCLNHTLRVWHLPTGRLVETRDLLDVAREPNERLQLSPAEPAFIKLLRFSSEGFYTLVTYSPHEAGQLKCWSLKGGLTGPLVIEDRFPNIKLELPDPDPTGNTVWSLTGLEIVPDTDASSAQIWALWRNNHYHQVYTLHFDLGNLSEDWKNNWVATNTASVFPKTLDFVSSDTADVTQKWLEFITTPGRYSAAVLEASLARYQEVTSIKTSASAQNKPLMERLCSVIAASVSLRKYDDEDMDFDRFDLDTDHQWRNFWRIVESINDQRGAPLSLSFDKVTQMLWVSHADSFSAVRECSRAELSRYNSTDDLIGSQELIASRWPHRKIVDSSDSLEGMSRILHLARNFRKSFPPDLAHDFVDAIEDETYATSEISTPQRIVLIFNQVGFSDQLSEGAEQQLLNELGSLAGANALSNDLIYSILRLLSSITSKKPKTSLRSTLFGFDLLSSALLGDVLLTRDILFDILVLIIFVDESASFDPPELFEQTISILREQERNLWLLNHSRLASLELLGATGRANTQDPAELTRHNGRAVSVMEDIFIKYVRPQPAVDRPMTYLLTDMISETQKWASGRDVVSSEDAVVHIQCFLLAHGETDLAIDFLKFQPSTPWANYVKARLQLQKEDYSEAATYFRRAAYTLACGKAIGDVKEMSANLLSLLDAEHFNSGLPRYFQHVMSLFEAKQIWLHTAEFARLALEGLTPGSPEPVKQFKLEILSRLFNAELKSGRFEAAYETLVQLPKPALQKSCAISLLNAILDPRISATSTSGALKIIQRMPWLSHPHLAAHLDTHLANLAKKQGSIPGLGQQWTSNPPVDYLSLLHALRLSRRDYRGATTVLFDRLRIVQRSGQARSDPQSTKIRQALLALINAMSCVSPDEAYLLADIDNDPRQQSMKKRSRATAQPQSDNTTNGETTHPAKRRRIIITLDDLRREYQQVLDKCSRIERGDFTFGEEGSDSEDDFEESRMTLTVNGGYRAGDLSDVTGITTGNHNGGREGEDATMQM